MAIDPTSFNAHTINDSNYKARLLRADQVEMREIAPVLVRPIGGYPRHVRFDPKERTFPVRIQVLAGSVDTLKGWFEPGTEGEFLVNYSGVTRALDCFVQRIIPYDSQRRLFTAVLTALDPRWRSDPITTDTSQRTSSGATWTVSNSGDAYEDKAIITLTPKTAKTAANSWLYKYDIVIANRTRNPLSNHPTDLTNGGWDHASEVAAGRSQSDGDDIRVLVDGVVQPHWFGAHANNDPNSALTTVWTNLTLAPGIIDTKLYAAITNVSPANNGDLEVVDGGTNGWPSSGHILTTSGEVISYTGITEKNSNGREAFTGITRARRNTTAAAASANSQLLWVQRRIQIMTGHTGVVAADTRDDIKPLLDLTQATPAALSNIVWPQIVFADSSKIRRSASWFRRTIDAYWNALSILEATGNPVAAMVGEYRLLGGVAGKPSFNEWYKSYPTGLLTSSQSAWRAVASQSFSAANNVTVNKPSGIVDDDLMIAVIAVATTNPGTITPPTGWTEIASQMGAAPFTKVYVKWASSEGASYQWSWDGGTRSGFGAIYGTQEAASVSLLSQGTSATTDVFPATCTPTLSPSFLVGIGAKNSNGAFTPPTDWTERFEAGSQVGLELVDRFYSGNANDRLVISSDSGPSSAGAYAILQVVLRGPIKFTRAISDTMALAHWTLDGDGNRYLNGYDLPDIAAAQTVNFTYTGAEQTWVVPAGITSIVVDARGASGNITGAGDSPGAGARVVAKLAVTPGETLRINVGGATGFNGGGTGFASGGGATDIRQGGAALTDRKITAGGGGGGSKGAGEAQSPGGAAGAQDGANGGDSALAEGGKGATTGAGGNGGSAGGGGGAAGGNGASGTGGNGATGGGRTSGGGGGGGLYGGGGGQAAVNTFASGGGGGGGSSGISGATEAQYFSGAVTSGADGSLSITYVATGGLTGSKAWVPYAALTMYEHSFVPVSPIVMRPPVGYSAGAETLTATETANAQQFTVPAGDEPFFLSAVRIHMDNATASSQLRIRVYVDASDAIGTELLNKTVDLAASSTPFWQTVPISPVLPLEPGQKYWIGIGNPQAASFSCGALFSYQNYPWKFRRTGSVQTAQAWSFALVCTPTNISDFDGYSRSDDGAQVSVSGLTAYLEPTGAPYVLMSARENAYWLNGVLLNQTTSESVTLSILCAIDDVIEIDMERRTVRNTTKGEDCLFGAKFSDGEDWIRIAPGTNTLQYTETGLARVDVAVSHYHRWN
jgi:hypothetical protein